MKRIKYTRELGTPYLVFGIQANNKDLGYITNPPEPNENTLLSRTTVKYAGKSRLEECKSFDVVNPYIEGVNGVDKINGSLISYTLDNTKYITNIETGETDIEIITGMINYTGTNYARDYVGFAEQPVSSDLQVERGTQNIMENFFRLKNVKSLKDFKETGFGFYKIYNQTI